MEGDGGTKLIAGERVVKLSPDAGQLHLFQEEGVVLKEGGSRPPKDKALADEAHPIKEWGVIQ